VNRPPDTTGLPLSGIRVLDLTIVWAGPFASQLLADMGAEVIRVESLQRPDVNTRSQPRMPQAMLDEGPWGSNYPDRKAGDRPWERSSAINLHSRNKLSITLDWERPRGMEIFKRLFAKSDVLLDNNAAATLEKLGITYEALSPLNPGIVWVSLPAYGMSGPYKYHKGYGANVEAIVGHTWLRGYTDSDPTTTYPVYHADAAAASSAAFAALAALWWRRRSGRGQHIDLSQAENMVHHLSQAVMDYSLNGRSQSTLGNGHPWMAPHDIFPNQGVDRWVAIAVANDAEFARLCAAIDRGDLVDDERFATIMGRRANASALREEIAGWTRQRSPIEAMNVLQHAGVRAGALHTTREVLDDPQLTARGFFETVDIPDVGSYPFCGPAVKMQGTPLHIRRHAPKVGQDNDYLYREVLGVSDAEYDELVAEEHIGDTYAELLHQPQTVKS
jgi:crotonobetainyl-CoA:carnitine CoA-transferase CaiB-like acyl-CoA transferase